MLRPDLINADQPYARPAADSPHNGGIGPGRECHKDRGVQTAACGCHCAGVLSCCLYVLRQRRYPAHLHLLFMVTLF